MSSFSFRFVSSFSFRFAAFAVNSFSFHKSATTVAAVTNLISLLSDELERVFLPQYLVSIRKTEERENGREDQRLKLPQVKGANQQLAGGVGD